MSELLYRWPPAAKFGGRIPKEKFYAHRTVNTLIREKFVTEVARITWTYKLATATINLPESPDVPEIEVFEVDAKRVDVSDQVLESIDRSIPKPIIFEINREFGGQRLTRMVAAHKQLSDAAQQGNAGPQISRYFTTEWIPAGRKRQPLPTAITLLSLYAALLEPLTNIGVRPGENMSEVAERLKTIGKLEGQIVTLERKLHNEKQLNRKVELRRALKTKQIQLEQQR